MSDQGKSNIQALGAGLLGFVAVLAVGGGAVMLHNSQRTQAAAKPAGAPIDLSSPVPEMSASASRARENRAQSPAPLIGDVGDEAAAVQESASAAGGSAAASAGASAGAASSRLKVSQHLDVEPGASSAKAVVRNTVAPEEEPAAAPSPRKAAPKLEPMDASEAVASVHYGVTSRNELMGRAAGPVYNIKGAKNAGGNLAAAGKMAGGVDARIADIRSKLESSGLPQEQREKLLKDLDVLMADAAKNAQ